MRNRTFDYSLPAAYADQNRTVYAGTCANPTYSTYSAAYIHTLFSPYLESKEMNDVLIANYEAKSARGMIFNNPMDSLHTLETISKSPTLNLYYWKKWNTVCNPDKWVYDGVRYEGDVAASFAFTLPIPELDLEGTINEAVTQAFGNIDISQAAALMSLAEGQQTISSLCSIFKRLIAILLDLKKLRLIKVFKRLTAKEIANLWMEARYAIRPLFYEVNGIVAALRVHDNARPFRQTFRGSSSDSDSDTYDYVSGDARVYANIRERVERTITVRSGVLTAIEEASELNIWGFDQPLETVWEVIPFSFIVDWFFNVGQTIASWTPEGGVRTLASWYVVEDTTLQTVTLGDHGIKDSYASSRPGYVLVDARYTIGTPFVRSKTIVSKYRIPNPSRALIPQFKLRLDARKLTDLMIIARQLFFRGH